MRPTRLIPILALAFAACAGEDDSPDDTDDTDVLPPEAWGPARDEPWLEGATMLTESELDALDDEVDVFQAPPPDPEALEAAEEAAMDEAEEVVDAWIRGRGLLGSPLERLVTEPPDLGSEDRELPDGNYEIVLPDSGGRRVVTLGRPSLLRGLRASFERLGDPENHIGAYRLMYEAFPEAIQEFDLPTPDEVDALEPADQLEVLGNFAELADRLAGLLDPGGDPPDSRPETCAGEVEAFENWDRQAGNADVEAPSAEGIYANFNWPQKWYATCVKDQANRGTCGSFGITAAMETAIALKFDRWVNLSEQDLYYHVRGAWNPSSYGDGIVTHAAWQDMLDADYLLPFESQWPYNRSDARQDLEKAGVYVDSCDGYQWYDPPSGPIPNYCSDTVHQGGAYCVNMLGFQVCGFVSAVPLANTSGYRAGNEFEIWDAANPDGSLAVTQLVLDLKLPTVLWAPVNTTSFDVPDANGFAPYNGSDEENRGSHIYQITGYVSNAQLATQLPDAPPGSGGGYVIAKNSWGDGWSDAGYIYLPYDWVKDYAISVTVLEYVQ